MANIAMENSTINVDASGDLTLLVGDPETEQETFLVSSKVMRLASPIWSILFDPQGRFMEANAKELALPDDDPDALLILLNIAHLNFDILTGPQCFAGLLKLALLCDKYDTAKLIRPWLGCWLETAPVEYRAPGHEEWLFIAWTFGKELVYNTLSKHLVSSISIDESGRYLNSKGTLLGESFPPGALGSIGVARASTIHELLNLCRNLVDCYTSSTKTVCQGFEMRNNSTEYLPACDAIVLGSLIKGLSNAGLWPIPEAPIVTMSVTALGAKLMKLTCHLKPVKGGDEDSAHESCLFTTAFRKNVQYILVKMENEVSASNLEHMKAQAEKCGSKVIKS